MSGFVYNIGAIEVNGSQLIDSSFTGNDSLVDTPTSGSQVDTGLGGQVTGNYCTANPLAIGGGTLSNGNLDYVRVSDPGGNTAGKVLTTIATNTGKWYFEYTVATSSTSSAAIGITSNIQGTVSALGGTNYVGMFSYEYCWRAQGQTINNGSYPTYGTAASNGDIIMCAFDVDAGKIWFGRNGTWFNSSSPSAGTSPAFSGFTGDVMPIFGIGTASAGFDANGSINFGQRPFAYTAPSGFKALCDTNLPAPVVAKSSTAMDVKLYTGTGSNQSITGLGFSPDFVWIKSRSTAEDHNVFDAVRGPSSNLYALQTNATSAEGQYGTMGSLDANGFSLTGAGGATNANGTSYVAWTWDAGSTTVTNTQGSITSSVRANPSAGFSVVTWSGTNNDGTIGHGLGAQPALIIAKNRTSANEWCVLHSKGYNGSWGAGYLRQTAAFVDITGNFTGSNFYDRTAPTSSVFSVSGNKYAASDSGSISGQNYVVYAFAPVTGYSSMGSYVASSGLPYVYLGFRPRFVLIKNITSSSTGWRIIDSARDSFNDGAGAYWLSAQSSGAEVDERPVDLLSNGFKLRMTDGGDLNYSSDTYIYAAFAESPFQYARAR